MKAEADQLAWPLLRHILRGVEFHRIRSCHIARTTLIITVLSKYFHRLAEFGGPHHAAHCIRSADLMICSVVVCLPASESSIWELSAACTPYGAAVPLYGRSQQTNDRTALISAHVNAHYNKRPLLNWCTALREHCARTL